MAQRFTGDADQIMDSPWSQISSEKSPTPSDCCDVPVHYVIEKVMDVSGESVTVRDSMISGVIKTGMTFTL